MKNDKVKSSQIMSITAAEIRENITIADIQSWGRQELVNFNRKVSDIMRKRKPALEKAGKEYGIYTALDRFHETYDKFPTATEMKHMNLNSLRKLSRNALNFIASGDPSTSAEVFERHQSAVRQIIDRIPEGQREEKIRKYLKEQGVKGVTSKNYERKFAKAIPAKLISDFWKAVRTISTEGIYGNLDSESLMSIAHGELVDYMENHKNVDAGDILASVRARVENVVESRRTPKDDDDDGFGVGLL